MGKRGPAPMPTQLRVLHGETRPSRINRNEPKIVDGEPQPPPWLSAQARPFWDYVLQALHGSKVLTIADRDAVAVYCEHMVNWSEMKATLRALGAGGGYMLRGARTGELVKNPLVAMIKNEALLCDRLRQELGMTPSARTGLVTPSESPAELERLLS